MKKVKRLIKKTLRDTEKPRYYDQVEVGPSFCLKTVVLRSLQHGIDTEHVAPLEAAWMEKIFSLVPGLEIILEIILTEKFYPNFTFSPT